MITYENVNGNDNVAMRAELTASDLAAAAEALPFRVQHLTRKLHRVCEPLFDLNALVTDVCLERVSDDVEPLLLR